MFVRICLTHTERTGLFGACFIFSKTMEEEFEDIKGQRCVEWRSCFAVCLFPPPGGRSLWRHPVCKPPPSFTAVPNQSTTAQNSVVT